MIYAFFGKKICELRFSDYATYAKKMTLLTLFFYFKKIGDFRLLKKTRLTPKSKNSPMLLWVGDPPNGRGSVANLPTCRALLILSPALKRWGPRQGLCSQAAQVSVEDPLDGKAYVAKLPTVGHY